MVFGQVVIGPPGFGKTTYCNGMSQFLSLLGRKVAAVNLDPANGTLPYECAINIEDLIKLSDVMAEHSLGPNGGLVYCMDYLEKNIDWLEEKLKPLIEDHYLLSDFPGQVELFFLHSNARSVINKLIKKMDLRLTAVHLIDGHLCCDPGKYVSALLLSLSTMLHMELPHINVLSKIDLIENYGNLGRMHFSHTHACGTSTTPDRAHLYRQRPPLVRPPVHRTHSPPTATAQRNRVILRAAPVPPVPLPLLPSAAAAFGFWRGPPDQGKLIGQTNGAASRPQTLSERRSLGGTSASSDVDELDQLCGGFPGRVWPRLRRHRAHPRPPGLLLRRPRRRRPQARPRRPRQAALPKGAGRGVAAGARVPAQRAARRAGQAREGGRGRRAVPAQGGPRGARRVRGPAPRAPRHVCLLPRSRRGRESRRRRHRRRVRAHLRGQGRRLDARRRRTLQDVRGLVQEDPPHEELRGRQPMQDLQIHACPSYKMLQYISSYKY